MTKDLFNLVHDQNINMKKFLADHYNIEWKKNLALCPFHDDTKPSFSYSPKLNTCKCFTCGAAGDLINFVKEHDFPKDSNKLNAAMKILDCLNIQYDRPGEKETTAETPEEIAARKAEFERKKKAKEEKRAKEQAQIQQAKKNAINAMTKKAQTFSSSLDPFGQNDLISSMFYNQSEVFKQWLDLYVGWDDKHKSICILNRTLDQNKTTYNIKHREKFEWDEDTMKHLDTRNPGKWLSYPNSTTYAFPYEYFVQKSQHDDKVFIVEGEKDALNLLSYDINVLTLGGVSTSWEDHKQLLKDKIVYIWFDHDKAGYENSVKKYKEIHEVASEVYIVLFYHINPSFPNKYDISDFIFEKKFKNKDDLLHSIAYSTYKLTTSLIEDIEEFTGLDLKEHYFIEPVKTVRDIKKEWVRVDKEKNPIHIASVKGEKDIKGLNEFLEHFKDEKKYKNFHTIAVNNIAESLINIDDRDKEDKATELIELMKNLASNYETLHKDYSQTHISDMVEAFEAMSRTTGNTFAKFGDVIAIWTGTHYQILEKHDDFERFVLKAWMPKARVDKKKRTTENVGKILTDVYTGAVSLDEIKHYDQKGKRVINFTNGTLFISAKGKITFKNRHDKNDACTNILKFEYDQNATCPKWTKFLNRNIPNGDDQATIMEFIGYCFLPAHSYEAFLYLYGSDGANGKSVIIDTLKAFFGKENTSALDLQNLKGHELEGLVNKLVNVGSELDTKNLRDGQMTVLKKLTSSKDDLQIDPRHTKGFLLSSENQPKMISAGNGELNPSSLDGGVLRRALQINCDIVIEDHEKVRELSTRFEDEMNGILNLALQHLQNLIKNGKFTKSDQLKATIEKYKDQSNPIRRYISDCLEVSEKTIIPKQYLYLHYKEYMQEKGNNPLSAPKFFEKLQKEIKSLEDIGQQRINVTDIATKRGPTYRPRFIKGIYCNSNDVFSFEYEKVTVKTENINYDSDTKQIVIKSQGGQN